MTEAERLAIRLDASIYYDDQKAAALLRSQAAEIERRREQFLSAEFAVEKLKAENETLRVSNDKLTADYVAAIRGEPHAD